MLIFFFKKYCWPPWRKELDIWVIIIWFNFTLSGNCIVDIEHRVWKVCFHLLFSHQFNLIPFVGLGLGAISALTGTAGSNYGAQATTQGAALGQLGGTLGTGLGLNQQLQGLGGLLQTQGSTGSTALTGGVANSTSALLGRGSSYGVDSTASAQSSYGLQNLSSFGITAGSTTSRLSDGVSRGYTPSSGSNNTNSSGTRVFVRNVSMWQ